MEKYKYSIDDKTTSTIEIIFNQNEIYLPIKSITDLLKVDPKIISAQIAKMIISKSDIIEIQTSEINNEKAIKLYRLNIVNSIANELLVFEPVELLKKWTEAFLKTKNERKFERLNTVKDNELKPEFNIFETIKFAIENKRVMNITYENNETRLVEPHTLGFNSKGNCMLSAFQVEGYSESMRNNCWKNFLVKNINAISIIENIFSIRVGFNPNPSSKMFREVLIQVN